MLARCVFIAFACLSLFASASPKPAPPSNAPELAALKAKHIAGQDAATSQIRTRYVGRLDALFKALTGQGNLDGSLAVEQELKSVKATGRTASAGASISELAALRTQYETEVEAALSPVRAKYLADLEKLQLAYTKKGALNSALAVREELKIANAGGGGRILPRDAADAVKHQGKLYKVFDTVMSWKAASAKCAEMGGRLAEVRNPEASKFIIELAGNGKKEAYWLGATDEAKEGEWIWTSGDKMAFKHWGPGQPNNKKAEEHFLLLMVRFGGYKKYENTWSDQPDVSTEHKPGFICEWD